MKLGRIVMALAAPFLLTGCLLSPGKFTSTLRISADRTFTFAYQGEVIQVDPTSSMNSSSSDSDSSDNPDQTEEERKAAAEKKAEVAKASADLETKRQAIAEALAKEAGYRSVRYVGDGKFIVDYEISGVLTSNFIYPFNLDGEVVFPFIAIEVRKEGTVRMKAPAFGKSGDRPGAASSGMAGLGAPEPGQTADGTFTLTTDAEIVAHNNEDGAKPAGAMKALVWRVTPLSKDAPSAVLRMAK